MPRREDIERFKEVLNSLGSEPEIRAAKSELIEEVAPPEEGLPADINELLGSFTQPLEEEPGAEDAGGVVGAAGAEEGGPSLEQEPSFEEEVLSLPEEAPPLEAGDEGLDFASLFGEQNEPHAIEDLENVPRQRQRETKRARDSKRERAGSGKVGQRSEGEAPAEEEAPAAPDEIPSEEVVSTEARPSPEESPAAKKFPLDLQSDIDQMEVLPGDEAMGAAPEEPQFEGIELPSLDDLQAAPEAAEGEPFGEQPAAEETPETPAAPRPPSPIEDFPTLESFDLGGTEAAEEPQAFGQQEQEPIAPAEENLSGGGMEGLGGGELGDLDMNEFDIPETSGPLGRPSAKPTPRAGQRAPDQRGQQRGRQPGAAAASRLAERARDGLRGAAKRAVKRIAPTMGRIAPSRAGRLEELEAAGAESAAGAPVELTPEQFDGLKKSLDALPRNLKIAVQDIIATGKGSAGQLAALVSLLVQGASAQDIAALAGRITGKRIRIPAGYEKKTGVAFEAERRTFGYAFRENIFPVLRLFVLSSLAVGLFAFLGYRFVYRPLYAYTNYSQGYEHISAERYSLANERFSRAVGVWPRRNWFSRYAEAFAGKRQFALAEEKYEQLLLRYPGDRRGILDYARMESRSLSNYEKADTLLQQLLDKNLYDYDALLAAGDNNLEWAERDPLRFEEARRSYAALITRYGQRDALLFRMLRYFIRTKKIDEVERLRVYYAERPTCRTSCFAP
ncbi:MAG: hypothetical protein NT005_16215 [Spirochaetes bacterium]|nr:hypothetical protein [Spirochaetota bacterium]